MRKPFALPVIRAFPAIKTAESRITPWVIVLTRLAGRAYIAGFIGNARVYLDEKAAGILIPAMERAFSRKGRCIIAFRHQNGWEPQVLMWFTLCRLGRVARERGVRFSLPPRIRFVHGYELFRWGGPLTRFMLPRFGAMPIHHAKLDRAGLDRIYSCLRDGPYPLAIAPEGQVSYTLAEEPRVEPGAVRIGLSAARELLRREGRGCPAVEILPVSLYPEYGKNALKGVERLLRRIERVCGIGGIGIDSAGIDNAGIDNAGIDGLHIRFLRCRELILALNEKRYGLARKGPGQAENDFACRLDALIEKALQSAAAILRVENPPGSTIDRLYIIRQICWDRIFPERTDPDALPALERALLDLRAGEAWHASRHMELADFSFYFHKPPPPAGASVAAVVEYAQNLYDFANRSMGGTYGTRRTIAPAAVRISVASPVNLTAMLMEGNDAGGVSGGGRKAVSAEANRALRVRMTRGTEE
jgi:1-acyl-sn-glycerol-3-phosphate acyltransferase